MYCEISKIEPKVWIHSRIMFIMDSNDPKYAFVMPAEQSYQCFGVLPHSTCSQLGIWMELGLFLGGFRRCVPCGRVGLGLHWGCRAALSLHRLLWLQSQLHANLNFRFSKIVPVFSSVVAPMASLDDSTVAFSFNSRPVLYRSKIFYGKILPQPLLLPR